MKFIGHENKFIAVVVFGLRKKDSDEAGGEARVYTSKSKQKHLSPTVSSNSSIIPFISQAARACREDFILFL